MKEYRRVPQSQLRQRLSVERYESHTPFTTQEPQPAVVRIFTKQHAGKPASAVVNDGDRVTAGQPIARMNEGELGADIHASITGRVRRITPDAIEIEA